MRNLLRLPALFMLIAVTVAACVSWVFYHKVIFDLIEQNQIALHQSHYSDYTDKLASYLQVDDLPAARAFISTMSHSEQLKRAYLLDDNFTILASTQIKDEDTYLVKVDSQLFNQLQSKIATQERNLKLSSHESVYVFLASKPNNVPERYYLYVELHLSSVAAITHKFYLLNLLIYSIISIVLVLILYLVLKVKISHYLSGLIVRIRQGLFDGEKNTHHLLDKSDDDILYHFDELIDTELATSKTFHQQLMKDAGYSENLVKHIHDGIIIIDDLGTILRVNESVTAIFGYTQDELIYSNLLTLVPSRFHFLHTRPRMEALDRSSANNEVLNHVRRVVGRRKNGTEFSADILIFKTHDSDGTRYTAIVKDVSELVKYESSLERIAFFDTITEAFNEEGLKRHLNLNREQEYSLCMLELVSIRSLNEAFGFEFGNHYMHNVTDLLMNLPLKSLLVARKSSNRFIISTTDDKKALIDALSPLQGHSIEVDDFKVKVEFLCSLTNLDQNDDIDEAIRYCRMSLYREDSNLESAFLDVDISWIDKQVEEIKLQQALSDAVDNHHLYFEFQPKFHTKTRQVASFEALLRWTLNGERISPGVFIPLAEKNKLMTRIDSYVIKLACQTIREWIDKGFNVKPIAINLSARYLFLENTIAYIFEKIGEYRVPVELLEIEITEYSLIKDFDNTADNMQRLTRAGVRIAIDDYGTGHSNLEAVAALPIQHLKIDQSFIKKAFQSKKSEIILQNITLLAQKLQIEITAEGVETEEHLHYLETLNCDYIQGYLMARPMPQKDIEEKYLTV